MLNYKEFQSIYSINESVLNYSDDFKKALSEIDSPIAKKLLEIESNDLDLIINYIDLDETNKGISFIRDDRLYSVDNPFEEKRQSMSVGRGIKVILKSIKYIPSDSEVEKFVNQYKATYDKFKGIFTNFELINGEEIKDWYLEDNYLDSTGTLGNSCMRYKSCQNFFDIYTDNQASCNLLILKKIDTNNPDGKIKGRALVWKIESPVKGYFMDRIYSNEDSDVDLFRKYASEKGWYYKKDNNSSSICKLVSPLGEEIDGKILVRTTTIFHDRYPFMDTLSYYHNEKGILTNSKDYGDNYIILDNTSGGYSLKRISNDDVEFDCPDCDGFFEITCPVCGGDGGEDSECPVCDGDGEIECPTCIYDHS